MLARETSGRFTRIRPVRPLCTQNRFHPGRLAEVVPLGVVTVDALQHSGLSGSLDALGEAPHAEVCHELNDAMKQRGERPIAMVQV